MINGIFAFLLLGIALFDWYERRVNNNTYVAFGLGCINLVLAFI